MRVEAVFLPIVHQTRVRITTLNPMRYRSITWKDKRLEIIGSTYVDRKQIPEI